MGTEKTAARLTNSDGGGAADLSEGARGHFEIASHAEIGARRSTQKQARSEKLMCGGTTSECAHGSPGGRKIASTSHR